MVEPPVTMTRRTAFSKAWGGDRVRVRIWVTVRVRVRVVRVVRVGVGLGVRVLVRAREVRVAFIAMTSRQP